MAKRRYKNNQEKNLPLPAPARELNITRLSVRPVNREVLDIGKWRRAIVSADNGRYTLLYNLYDDILIDGLLSRSIQRRVEAITNSEITFQIDGVSIEEMEDVIDTPAFERLLTEIMLAKFWGVSLLELDFSNGFDCVSIPRKHIRTKSKHIVINESDEDNSGDSYADDPFFLEVKGDDPKGLIFKAAQYAIYKRGGFGDWAQFVELFGQPFRVGKYNPYDDNTRAVLEEALDKAGSAPYLTIPNDAEVDIKETRSSGNGSLFDKLRTACNEEILYTILGQTMTTLNGSSRSQGEVHEDVESSLNKADRRFVQRILNRVLLPILEQRGFPVKGGWFNFPEKAEKIPLKERVEIDLKLSKKVDIDPDYWYETYGIPKPASGNTEPEKQNDKEDGTAEEENPEKKKEAEKKKLHDEQSFWEKLKSFFVAAPEQAGANNHPSHNRERTGMRCCGSHLMMKAPASSFDFDALYKRIATGRAELFDLPLFIEIAGDLLSAFRKGWKKLPENLMDTGFEYDANDPAMTTAFEMNIFRFAGAKTIAEVQVLNQAFRESKNFQDFVRRAEEITGKFHKAWRETEYNTAVLTGERASDYFRLKSKTSTFKYWRYKTVGDENVRPEHEALEGLILRHDDPHWLLIFPPNGWNCRCWVEGVLESELPEGFNIKDEQAKVDDFLNSSEWKKCVQNGFGINRADSGEVYSDTQMYINKFQSAREIEKLTYEVYGLKEVTQAQKQATDNLSIYEGTVEEWLKQNSELTDYRGRKININTKAVKAHTTGKKYEEEKRLSLMNAINEALKNPDEVWLNDFSREKTFNALNYIKYYKDHVIVTAIELNSSGTLELKTWFSLFTTGTKTGRGSTKSESKIKTERHRRRSGLLIKKKEP